VGYIWRLSLDLFSHRVIGRDLTERLDRGLALNALKRVLQARKPPQGLLHHSDRSKPIRRL
jgi:transposase InsO family protein